MSFEIIAFLYCAPLALWGKKQIISQDKRVSRSASGEKLLGLNGFSAHFFTSAWSVVGQDVSNVVLDFFNTRKACKEVNATGLSLVPKRETASKLTQFGPILCCYIIYKMHHKGTC